MFALKCIEPRETKAVYGPGLTCTAKALTDSFCQATCNFKEPQRNGVMGNLVLSNDPSCMQKK